MCGLCGIAGDLNKVDVGIFNNLLVLSSLRGKDSTGIINVPRNGGDVTFLKDTGDPYKLMENIHYERTIREKPEAKAFIGHTRSATVGKANRANAHPFVTEPIIGMHNGTLIQIHLLEDAMKKAGHKDNMAGTDSELLIRAIAYMGVEEAMKYVVGAYAVVWFNWKDGTLNMIRNNERDLYYAFDDKHRRMFWASEPGFIYTAINRPFYGQVAVLGEEKVRLLPENKWFSWKIPDKWQDEFPEPKVIVVKSRERPVSKGVSGFMGLWKDDSRAFKERNTAGTGYQNVLSFPARNETNGISTSTGGSAIPPDRLKQLAEAAERLKKSTLIRQGKKAKFFKGWNGNTMDREEYLTAVSKGCVWCSDTPVWEKDSDPDIVRFISRDDFLCSSCMKDDEVLGYCNLKKEA